MALNRINTRCLHILQSPSTNIPTSLNVSHLVKSVPELKDSVPSGTSFEVIESSLLRVGLAPSTELYTKRKSLIASFGDSLVSTMHLRKALSRAWAGQWPIGYQKLVSSAPVSALISSNAPLAVVTLDGTIDWVVVGHSSLHSYTGERLVVEAKRKFQGNKIKHSFLSGRGTVALSGNGHLYKVTMGAGESFMALKDTVVAYSTDANNKSSRHGRFEQLPYSLNQQEREYGSGFVEQAKSYWGLVKETFTSWLHSDSGKYIRLEGPSTLIMQSATPQFALPKMEQNLNVNPLETRVKLEAQTVVDESHRQSQLQQSQGMPRDNGDYLKIATIKDGKVTFESTQSFEMFYKK